MELRSVFRPNQQSRVAFVGAGGKTTALFRLAREIKAPVLVTTTTRLGEDQAQFADRTFFISAGAHDFESVLDDGWEGVALISRPPENGKLMNLAVSEVDCLHVYCATKGIPLLIEADGAKSLPLKTPAQYEPVIPAWVTDVAVMAGLSGLGQPMNADWVHRPELFEALTGCLPGESVSVQHLVAALSSPAGGLKGIPGQARKIAFLNQSDAAPEDFDPRRVAEELLRRYDAVAAGQLQAICGQGEVSFCAEPVAGVLLAAGASSRFGALKQLFEWEGEPLVRHQARIALESGLHPVVVVVGNHAGEVRAAVAGLDVVIVENDQWQNGQGTSVRTGVQALSGSAIGAAIFLVCDQPQVERSVILALIERHRTRTENIIAPDIDGKRTNPVLFDRSLFSELAGLPDESGGRYLFERHAVERLPWNDERLLLDIDYPEDYVKLKS